MRVSLCISFLPQKHGMINHPKLQWLKTKASVLFVIPGQWLWWLSQAWLDCSGLGSPSSCWWGRHLAMTTEMIWLPSTCLSHLPGGLPGHILKTISRRAKASRSTQRLFPASACVLSADSSLMEASSKLHSDPKGQGSRLYCISKKSCEVIQPNASQWRKVEELESLIHPVYHNLDF